MVSTQIPSLPRSLDRRESPWAGGLTVVAATFLVIAGGWVQDLDFHMGLLTAKGGLDAFAVRYSPLP